MFFFLNRAYIQEESVFSLRFFPVLGEKYSARNALNIDSPTGSNCAGLPTKITLPPKLGRINVRRFTIGLSVPNITIQFAIISCFRYKPRHVLTGSK